MSHDARPLKRITVFDPEVIYPKPAIPYKVLPDDLLQHFHRVFKEDQRGEFPAKLLEEVQWTTCSACNTEHARRVCPNCVQAAPILKKDVISVRGMVTSERVFYTHNGTILASAVQAGKLRYLYHEEDRFLREDGTLLMNGFLTQRMRYRIHNDATVIGADGQMITLASGQQPDKRMVDSYGALSMFDANGGSRFWLENGALMRDGHLGPERIGGILSGQTVFWVGTRFGFGFYRAGQYSVAFVFSAEHRVFNDGVKLTPPLRGQLVDATCVFSGDYGWFLVAMHEKGKILNRCYVVRGNGSVEAGAEAEAGDNSWLSSIRGKCAAGNFLFAPTDDGMVKIEVQSGQVIETKRYPDTEPFVDSGSTLHVGTGGIYVVDRREIRLLKMK